MPVPPVFPLPSPFPLPFVGGGAIGGPFQIWFDNVVACFTSASGSGT